MSLTGIIAFSSGWSCDFDIWSLDLQTGQLAQLTTSEDVNDMPVFSPKGDEIAFIRTGADMIPSLCVMNSKGGSLKRLTTDLYCNHPSWSPDGSKILFTANKTSGDEIDLCVCDRSSGRIDVVFSKSGIEREPSFSPDGNKIVYAAPPKSSESTQEIHTTDIWLYDLNTKKDTLLCSHPARDYGPVFSPDGTSIAFVSHRNERSSDAYSSALSKIQNTIENGDMASIDKAIEEIQALEQDSDIYVMNADGTEIRQLTSNPGADVGACWSPCGKYLAYTSSAPGNQAAERIKIIEVETGRDVGLKYDRAPLRADIEGARARTMNRSIWQKVIPDFIERKFIDKSYWGEERRPSWTA